jgi:hypothetical protein
MIPKDYALLVDHQSNSEVYDNLKKINKYMFMSFSS